jgi:two-component system nitrate/nitrite response regulator NarL
MTLTKRQREIAQLVAKGLSNKEIARMLTVTEGTIKLHIHHAFQKTGARNRTGLALAVLKIQES